MSALALDPLSPLPISKRVALSAPLSKVPSSPAGLSPEYAKTDSSFSSLDRFSSDVASQVTQLSGRMYNFFALIDQQTANDRTTALLVSAQTSEKNSNECTLDTVRVYMTEAQIALSALKLGSLGFEEIKSQAERNGGVYGSPPPGQPSKGMPAPRKQLGT